MKTAIPHILNRPGFHLLAIIIFTVLAYANTFDVPFHLDDIASIVNSPAIKSFAYFTDPGRINDPGTMEAFDKPLFKTRYVGYFTFALNHAVHGLDVWGYHLVNLLIHLGAALLLYRLLVLIFRTPRFAPNSEEAAFPDSFRSFIALFSALLFAVHPLQTQAVTYIVQRFASLATMLWLLSLVSYLPFRLLSGSATVLKRSAWYALSLLAAVLAMKTKEFALLLPVVVLLTELMFLEGTLKKRVQYLLPLFLTMLVVPLSLLNSSASGLGESAAKISGAQGSISRLDYLFTQFRVIVTYIRLLLAPVNQMFDYDYPIYRSFFAPPVFMACVFLLAILLTGVYLLIRSRAAENMNRHLHRLIAFGIFWFFITISAESSIIPIADVIFEHRLYLPSIGFFIAAVSAVALLCMQWRERTPVMLNGRSLSCCC